MNLFSLFGISNRKIADQGCSVTGTVTSVRRSYLYVIKKPVRLYPNESNTRFSHYVTFTYSVDGTTYTGKRWVSCQYRCPQVGENIILYYDPKNPQRCACVPFLMDTRRF